MLRVGAYAAFVDLFSGYTCGKQLQTIGCRKIQMIFLFLCVPAGYLLHIEGRFSEGLIHLYAYLEGVERDAWSYDGMHVGGSGTISFVHGIEHGGHDTRHCTSLSCVHGSYGSVCGIVEEDGYAVGRRYAEAQPFDVGHYGIFIL